MKLHKLCADEDAVSPVIGVILMVAITVILAAVIGTFVIGFGEQVENSPPQAQFTFDEDPSASTINSDATNACTADDSNSDIGNDAELTITHDGGDTIPVERVTLVGASGVDEVDWTQCSAQTSGDEISAGNKAYIDLANSDTLRVVWTSEDGDSSDTLANYDGSDA